MTIEEAKELLGVWSDTLIGMTDNQSEEMLRETVASFLEAQSLVERQKCAEQIKEHFLECQEGCNRSCGPYLQDQIFNPNYPCLDNSKQNK